MSSTTQKPNLLLKIILIKKGIFALILLTLSVLCSIGWRYDDVIVEWANTHLLNAEYGVVGSLLARFTEIKVSTLKLIARASGAYGGLLGIAVTGLWFSKPWADPLFIGLVGILIPFEIYEVLRDFSPVKLLLLAVNLIVFTVLVRHLLNSRAAV